MAEMYNDPERLRQFAASLGRFLQKVNEDMDQSMGAIAALGSSFRDQGYDELRSHYQRAHATMQQLKNECDKIRPELLRDAEQLEAYLRVHMGR